MVRVHAGLLTVAGVLLLASGAGAQVIVGPIGGGSAGNFICTANVANPTQATAESWSALLGDITIVCTGGAAVPAPGTPVPTANITVALNNTLVTSRVFGVGGVSEVLLLIDEPGSWTATGAGTLQPQTLCSSATLGAAAGGCSTVVGVVGGVTAAVLPGTSTVPNVFTGIVNGNTVTFNGIPFLAPVTSGYARVFRITNLRGNAAQFGPPLPLQQGQTPILTSLAISNGPQLQNSLLTTAYLYTGLSGAVRNAANTSSTPDTLGLSQCGATALTPGAILRFNEAFAAAFKTRVNPTLTYSGAASGVSSFAQNVPGQFSPGSESGFIFPGINGSVSNVAGLADFGTRLKATFNNVPAGVQIFVSTTNLNSSGGGNSPATTPTNGALLGGATGSVPTGNLTTLLAALVTGETAVAGLGGSLPLLAPTNSSNFGGGPGVLTYGPLPVDANGTATAVWEILTANPNAFDRADFGVYYQYTGVAGSIPATSPVGTVSLSLGPTFGSLTASGLIPRFTPAADATAIFSGAACTIKPTTMALSFTPAPITSGQAANFTATVSGAGGTPTGTVTFRDGLSVLGAFSLDSGGVARINGVVLGIGVHLISATYNGDASFLGTSSSLIVSVHAPTNTALSITPGTISSGQAASLTATVSGTGGTPTGTVTFRDGATVLGTVTLDSGSVARLNGVVLAIGTHPISATYNGDASFLVSSVSQIVFVGLPQTSVSTPVLRSGTPLAGQTLTFAATVTGEGPLTGTLTFRDSGVIIGSAVIDGIGTGVITTSTLGIGFHSITASYGGDATNGASSSGALGLTIRGTATVTLVSSLNPAPLGSAITLTATVAAPSGAPAPVGNVTFTEGSATLGTAAVNGSGQAALALPTGLGAGDHSIVATYSGNTLYLPSSSAALVQKVTAATTTATLIEGVGANGFYLTAGVTAPGGGSPSGAVEFRDLTATTTLGSGALSNGSATIALAAPLPVGHNLQAVYAGDAAFGGSNSEPLTFVAASNGFSFTGGTFAVDEIAAIFGAGLAGSPVSAPTLPLPTTLGGVTVQIVDEAGASHTATIYFVSPGQINFVVPADVPPGPARLLITTPGGRLTLSITVTRSAPSLASSDGTGTGMAAAYVIRGHADGTQDAPLTISRTPISFGSATDQLYLVLYGTGFRHGSGVVSCRLNGQPVDASYAGAHSVYPGLDQINLQVPGSLRGAGQVTIACSVDGQTSNSVAMVVQ